MIKSIILRDHLFIMIILLLGYVLFFLQFSSEILEKDIQSLKNEEKQIDNQYQDLDKKFWSLKSYDRILSCAESRGLTSQDSSQDK